VDTNGTRYVSLQGLNVFFQHARFSNTQPDLILILQVLSVNNELNERVYIIQPVHDSSTSIVRSENFTMRQMAEKEILIPVEFAAGSDPTTIAFHF